jgi:NhaA family Na+:H+ antiporter
VSAWRTAVPRLSRFAVEHLLLLPLGAIIALVWVNALPESYFLFAYAIAFPVNDIAMVFFFGLIMKEVVEATAAGGVLHPWRRALLPVVASIGATAVPALVHIQIVEALEEPMLADAWPVSLAVDLAVTYFVARFIFQRHPIIPFLLLLGIASDALGLLAVALISPTIDVRLIGGGLILAAAIAVALGLRWYRVKSFWPYLIAAGGLSWYAFFYSGLRPALALVPIMPFLPHAARDPGFFVDANPKAHDALSQFETWWKYPAQVALFFFGLVNAGVPLGALEIGTWGLPIAVVVGKPVGLMIGAAVAMALGLHMPFRVRWRELGIGGLIIAVGFSVGLFFTSALLPPGQLRSEMNMGVLLSLVAAPLAVVLAKIIGVGRPAPTE